MGDELHTAAMRGDEANAGQLLDAGTPVDWRDEDGWTALMWAATEGHTGTAELLLDRGADLEAKESDGWTAIILAADGGHDRVARMLLDRGADSEVVTNAGISAAGWCNSDECKAVLRDAERIQRWHRRRQLAAWRH